MVQSIVEEGKVEMTPQYYTLILKPLLMVNVLALSISQAFALQPLSDETLSRTTGEGIAFVPQDAYMVFQGEHSTAADLTNRQKDTGYIHLTPVGPLTDAALDTNKNGVVDGNDRSVGKADLFLYGLALSKSDSNHNNRIASSDAAAKIASWGTATNPWILKVGTAEQVPNFDVSKTCGNADDACKVPYLTLEAPLYDVNVPDAVADGGDAYKLKLGMWADAFVLDPSKQEGNASLYQMGERNGQVDTERANRLRLQAIWNHFSLNGSNIKLFQTLGGSTNQAGMSTFYNNTLGISALLRLNSGDAANLRTASNTSKIMRLSTREVESSTSGLLDTPALNGTDAPIFDSNEGLFLHNLNANLVLGSLYQPLILSSDGRNFTIELARIPNKPEIYKKIYTDYTGKDSTYQGSTCNVYRCGNDGVRNYHGSNATHSSITIGSTVYNSTTNTLNAYKGVDAVGVSFGSMNPIQQTPNTPVQGSFSNMGSAVIDGVLIQHLKITTKGL